MIFAAGRGSRLGPLGEQMPKALLEVGGITLLERTMRNLVAAGADRIIVNVSHLADRMVAYLERLDPSVDVRVSHEPGKPLETGGGLLHARSHFRHHAPFFLHNVDVLTDADLPTMYDAHLRSGALATLATNRRDTPRRLLFDERGLFGREDARRGLRLEARPPEGDVRTRAFAGIHVVAPAFFGLVTETGFFSILDPYLRLAAEGHCIADHAVDDAHWMEVGTPDRLDAARAAWRDGID